MVEESNHANGERYSKNVFESGNICLSQQCDEKIHDEDIRQNSPEHVHAHVVGG